jgi:hypothetical protein
MSEPPPNLSSPSRGALALGFIPFAAMCFSVALWDRVQPLVFGLPFNLFWLLLWIVLTPCCLWGAYRLECKREMATDQHP